MITRIQMIESIGIKNADPFCFQLEWARSIIHLALKSSTLQSVLEFIRSFVIFEKLFTFKRDITKNIKI